MLDRLRARAAGGKVASLGNVPDAYTGAAAEARERGWRVEQVAGEHLHIATAPEAVTDALIRLAS
jgi:hypothetical protein